jgi:transmembrane sensor
MKNNNKYSNKDWEELASILSGEKGEQSGLLGEFAASDRTGTVEKWQELSTMSDQKNIDVNEAWDKLYSRMDENGLLPQKRSAIINITRNYFLRIAATFLVIIGLGTVAAYFITPNLFTKRIIVVTSSDQKNIRVSLPDGSTVFLNRSSKLTYRSEFVGTSRNVNLEGEAFFDIAPDKSKPFIIDAGKASVKVVGTSFNVITNNNQSEVEVFVKTGNVILSDNTGTRSLALEPGYVGTMDDKTSDKKINTDPNYLSWNTGLLVYNDQTLDVVFKDLKRVYNMNIVADDPAILKNTWTSPIDNQPQETIIRLICASFNLSYSKVGDVYHLTGK